MAIKYIDKTHAKLIVSFGSGKGRSRRTKNITYKNKRDAEKQYSEFKDKVESERTVNKELTVEGLLTMKGFEPNTSVYLCEFVCTWVYCCQDVQRIIKEK